MYTKSKNYWKHDGFLPLQMGDLLIHFFTFGGAMASLDDGAYYGVACTITQMTAGAGTETTEPSPQLFATDMHYTFWLFSFTDPHSTGIYSYVVASQKD